MAIFRHVHTLLSVTEETDEDQVGSTYLVMPSDGDTVPDYAQSWRVFFDVTQSGGDTSPTTDARLETSHDGTNWVEVAKATQLTADGEVHEFVEVSALGPYVRAMTELAGGTNPTHTAVVKLASSASFYLKSA